MMLTADARKQLAEALVQAHPDHVKRGDDAGLAALMNAPDESIRISCCVPRATVIYALAESGMLVKILEGGDATLRYLLAHPDFSQLDLSQSVWQALPDEVRALGTRAGSWAEREMGRLVTVDEVSEALAPSRPQQVEEQA